MDVNTNTKLLSPRFSYVFITLPQVLLAMFFCFAYQITGMVPTLPVTILFGIQIAFNVYIVFCATDLRRSRLLRKHENTLLLAGFIAIMSVTTPFLIKQFNFMASLAAEAFYVFLCLIPLIYITTTILYRKEIPLMRIGIRIALCAVFPLVTPA
ncbi:MAG: hypothetical protein FWG40_12530 [Peptococcaceae bacterium]|nr:hypothetical protein [Peptococcaceae bacterium]